MPQIGQGKANEAMSEIFEMLDRASDAVAHMEKYLEVVGSVGLLTKVKHPASLANHATFRSKFLSINPRK